MKIDFSSYLKYLPYLLWGIAIIVTLILLWLLTTLIIRILNWHYLKSRDMVFLELTPPASGSRTPIATEQLFSVVHGYHRTRSLKDKILRRNVVLAFEVVSTKQGGVRYIIQVEKQLAHGLQQAITSYLPDVKVMEVADFLPRKVRVVEFKQAGHYAFPLAFVGSLDQRDPVSYLTGAMTKLTPDELMGFQIVLTPIKSREAKTLARRILNNEDLLTRLSRGTKNPILPKVSNTLGGFLLSITDTASEMYNGTTSQSYNYSTSQLKTSTRDRPSRTLSTFELEIMETIHRKLNQPLFQVNIRALVNMQNWETAKERLSAIGSSLASYDVETYQALHMKARVPLLNHYRRYLFRNRLPSMFMWSGNILAASEVASLYHFPLSRVSKTDNLVTSLSRSLPAPLSLKQDTIHDVIIGKNEHHGVETIIGLGEKERERHMYIIGGTGNGKTTMLQYMIEQDMKSGKGLAVIDPHGDMAETILRHIPPERVKDVVYFNPDDLEYPIGLNLLELAPNLEGSELLREKDLVTESVISIFRKIFSEEDSGGHRIEYVLRNAVQTALTVEDATLFTVFRLLEDPKYRNSIVKTLENKDLKNFWTNELGKAGGMQRVKMAAGITSKIGRFLFSASAKQILEQPKSTIDFDDIINSGKILICNFSKGLLGEDTSELFGITVLAKLQLASLRRARLSQTERRPFYLYVDEFQNFATQSFVQMLSESRKYKLFMTMAEQSTSQQKDQQMVSIILANVGTVICFRTGNPDDERLLLPLFSPYIQEGEISNLNAFNFYVKLSAMKAQEPLSGQTLLLEEEGSESIVHQAIKHSQQLYGRKEEISISPKITKARGSNTNTVNQSEVVVPGQE